MKLLIVMICLGVLGCKHYPEKPQNYLLEGKYQIKGISTRRGGTMLKLSGSENFEIFFRSIHVKKCEPKSSFCPFSMSKSNSNSNTDFWTCSQYYDGRTLYIPKNNGVLEVDSLGYVKINGKPYYFEHQIECVDSLSTEG